MEINEIIIDENAGKDLKGNEFFIEIVVLNVECKQTSRILQLFAEKLPLAQYNLPHIKRVRRKDRGSKDVDIVICPVDLIKSIDVKFWADCGLELHGSDVLEHPSVTIASVPKYEPKNRQEFDAWFSVWPVSFHPDELQRSREAGLGKEEVDYANNLMLYLLSEFTFTEKGDREDAAIIVNPNTQEVICSSKECRERLVGKWGESVLTHPLYPPALLCIDQVAALAREELPGKEKLPAGHYLCTGLDLFIVKEPDLFASMALVHSRIRRVYFVEEDRVHGALASGSGHIHSLRALNHHYRVFQVTPPPPPSPPPPDHTKREDDVGHS